METRLSLRPTTSSVLEALGRATLTRAADGSVSATSYTPDGYVVEVVYCDLMLDYTCDPVGNRRAWQSGTGRRSIVSKRTDSVGSAKVGRRPAIASGVGVALVAVLALTTAACDPGIAPAVVVNGCPESVRVLFDEGVPGFEVNPDIWEDLAVVLAPGGRLEAYAIHQNGEYLLIVYPDSGEPVITRIPFADGRSPDDVMIEGQQCPT